MATEALEAFHATEFSRNIGLQQIVMEGDALKIVNVVRSTGRNLSRFE